MGPKPPLNTRPAWIRKVWGDFLRRSLSRERRRRWIEKQDPFTVAELERRDAFFYTPSLYLHTHGFTANRITLLGSLLNLIWCVSYFSLGLNILWIHILFAVLIGFTDALDGSVARNNDDVTLVGILGDHFRDLGFLLSAGGIALAYGFPLWLYLTFISVELLLFWLKWKSFLRFSGHIYSKELFFDFAEENFQHIVADRYYGIFYFIGLPLFGFSTVFFSGALREIALVLMGISLTFGALILYSEYNWQSVD